MIKQELTRKDLVEYFENSKSLTKSYLLKDFFDHLIQEFGDPDLSYCDERKDFVYTGPELPKIKVKKQ